jgi:hypothetical protein
MVLSFQLQNIPIAVYVKRATVPKYDGRGAEILSVGARRM